MKAAYWIVALLALAFNLFALWDMWGALSDPAGHLSDYPELAAMIGRYPEWRVVMWATTVFIGIIGALMLFLRRAIAERALWAATGLLALGIILDYALFGAARAYGPSGILFNAAIVAVEGAFALYARRAARHGLLA